MNARAISRMNGTYTIAMAMKNTNTNSFMIAISPLSWIYLLERRSGGMTLSKSTTTGYVSPGNVAQSCSITPVVFYIQDERG
jgi:hypothetical protein